ncbi:hypothetical protein ACINWC323_0317 [Acinetobacter sp. WC-323]|nr:hypothetical protein ACINWC323_0317 [Acinetobacter sp. WC-323]
MIHLIKNLVFIQQNLFVMKPTKDIIIFLEAHSAIRLYH